MDARSEAGAKKGKRTARGGGGADFALTVGWYGPQDKPAYRAILLSPARAGSVEEEPFIGVAVIERKEFDAAVAVARARGLPFEDGPSPDSLGAYALEVEEAGHTSHCSLGFDRRTIEVIAEIREALEPAHREPVTAVLEQLRTYLPEEAGTAR
jgi:hypothetical protein